MNKKFFSKVTLGAICSQLVFQASDVHAGGDGITSPEDFKTSIVNYMSLDDGEQKASVLNKIKEEAHNLPIGTLEDILNNMNVKDANGVIVRNGDFFFHNDYSRSDDKLKGDSTRIWDANLCNAIKEICNAIKEIGEGEKKSFYEKVEKYKKENVGSTAKDFWWYLPFTDPYCANKQAEKDFGSRYAEAVPLIYSDDAYKRVRSKEAVRLSNEREELALLSDINRALASGDSQRVKDARRMLQAHRMENFAISAIGALSEPETKRDLAYFGGGALALLFSSLGSGVWNALTSVADSGKRLAKRIFSKSMDASNYKELLEGLRKRLKGLVVGQDEAIDSIINQMMAYYSNKLKCEELGIPYNKGLVLYFIGPPGVGKSLIMDAIKEFLGLTTYSVGMKDVVEDKGNNPENVMAKLLKPVPKDNGSKKWEEPTEFATILSYQKPTLYIIDEIDKLRLYDYRLQKIDPLRPDGKLAGSSADEFLRSFMDDGKLGNFDAAGSVVIVTSNESIEDIQNLEESLWNRYKTCIVQFKPFDAKACAELLKRNLKEINGAYYAKNSTDVVWDEKTLSLYSKELEKQNMNGRNLKKLSDGFTLLLDKFYEKHPNVKKMTLKYSNEKGVYVE